MRFFLHFVVCASQLNRATIQNPVTGKLEYADYRISKSAWLREELDPMVTSIRQRVSDYSGLELKTAEELQVSRGTRPTYRASCG